MAIVSVAAFACGSDPTAAPKPAAPAAAPSPTFVASTPPSAPARTVCATGEYEATRSPVNVLFLYDRSGSMHIVLPSSQTRWQAAENGLSGFLEELPSSVAAGLMLFPQGDAPVNQWCGINPTINDVSCTSGWPEPSETTRCDATRYAPTVASASLDRAQIAALEAAVHACDNDFYWGTPLSSALTAAIASQRASTLPGPKSIVLVTDGNPTSCDATGITDDISNVVDAATAGVDPTKGDIVRTYVIGLTDSSRQAAKASNLSPIAVAGGTARAAGCETDDSCFYKLTDATFATDLAGVFDQIGNQSFSCTFDMPAESASTDPALINVEVNAATVSRDTSHQSGWDYLTGNSQIQLYGDTCTAMKDDAAKLQIVLGCKTVTVR